jgi:uncharacterized repeat protein (TIGR04138 family)
MEQLDFDRTIEVIIRRDPRYRREAYVFVREALDFTQKRMLAEATEVRHVTGQELLEGIRGYALKAFGPMAMLLLSEWGVTRCEDFGELVFNMVESGLLAKTEKDSREDFKGGYEFSEAFQRPFLPDSKQSPPQPKHESTQA